MNRHFLTVSIITCLLILSTIAYAMEKGDYQPPSLDGYTLESTKQLDKDEIKDGIKETIAEIYKKGTNELIGKYTTNGKTWAWAIYHNLSNRQDYASNYVICDLDGDGVFETRYSASEDFYLPDWVKKAGNK